ncbi:MAG: hypothetical protein WC455_24675 [Dehalococcoidia bacterium]|jgi:hypothetical protein
MTKPLVGVPKGALYHWTPYEFDRFEPSSMDIGIHFGSKEQALARKAAVAKDESSYGNVPREGRLLKVRLNLRKPLVLTSDITGMPAPMDVVDALEREGAITREERRELALSLHGLGEQGERRFKEIWQRARTAVASKIESGALVVKEVESDIRPRPLGSLAPHLTDVHFSYVVTTKDGHRLSRPNVVMESVPRDRVEAARQSARDGAVFEIARRYVNKEMYRIIESLLKRKGYDGLVYPNRQEGGGQSYAVFDPDRISVVATRSLIHNPTRHEAEQSGQNLKTKMGYDAHTIELVRGPFGTVKVSDRTIDAERLNVRFSSWDNLNAAKKYLKGIGYRRIAFIENLGAQRPTAKFIELAKRNPMSVPQMKKPWEMTESEFRANTPQGFGYVSNLPREADVHTGVIRVGPKFFRLSEGGRKGVITHEHAHALETSLTFSQWSELMDIAKQDVGSGLGVLNRHEYHGPLGRVDRETGLIESQKIGERLTDLYASMLEGEDAWLKTHYPIARRKIVEFAVANGLYVPGEVLKEYLNMRANPVMGRIIPYSPSLKITNLGQLPRGTGARYLEVIRGENDTLAAKQWRRSVISGVLLVDMKPASKGMKTNPTGRRQPTVFKTTCKRCGKPIYASTRFVNHPLSRICAGCVTPGERKVLRNPLSIGGTTSSTSSLYQSFHGNPSKGTRRVRVNIPEPGDKLVKIGRLTELRYRPENPSQHVGMEFYHKLGDTGTMVLKDKPILATGPNGKGLFIINDKASPRMTGRGIIG